MTRNAETLKDILTELMERENLSDAALGQALGGYSDTAVLHWRQLRSVPNVKVWHRLAWLSGRTIEQIACAIARSAKPVPARRRSAIAASKAKA